MLFREGLMRMGSSTTGILEAVRSGAMTVEEAADQLRVLQYEDLGFAKVDHHRAERTGRPEVVYAPGKTLAQIQGITQRLYERGDGPILVTRADEAAFEAVSGVVEDAVYHEAARIVVAGPGRKRPKPNYDESYVAVVAAGTADLPVAEEAAVTLEYLGDRVERVLDVGVAGLHRLLGHLEVLASARALVVAAGMEGALPSVVAGLVSQPVVAVPTSVGYGASLGGIAALLAMLNSCASGISVMNIDNGFGAGVFASLINQ
jgi:pyridinium-3,5-biscarboxylic acid mononucleotide synthase